MANIDPDTVIQGWQDKTSTRFGVGATVLPWAAILAALESMLSLCPSPTPATFRAQLKRPLYRARVFDAMFIRGVPNPLKVLNAFSAEVDAEADESVASLIAAVQAP